MEMMNSRRMAVASRAYADSELDSLSEQAPSAARGHSVPLLTQALSIARRRKWVLIGAVVAALVVGLIATMLVTPKYTASATIEIQRETGSFVNVEGAKKSDNFLDQEFYQTQYGLLQSQALAERVATDLRLGENREFFEMFGVDTQKLFDTSGPRPVTRADRIRAAGGILLKHSFVRPQRLSRLVTIGFTAPDPDLAQRVVMMWSTDFVKVTLERRFNATAYARNFLETRLQQLRTRINESQRQLVDYASAQGIINLPSNGSSNTGSRSGGMGERSLVVDDLAMLNQELAGATADRVRAESRLRTGAGNAAEALGNTAINTLRQKRAEAAADYARMLVQFEPEYPPARALQQQIAQLDRSIATEEGRVRSSIRETFNAAQTREEAIRGKVENLKSGVLDQRRRSIQYDIIQREVDTNQQLYDALLQRFKEIGVAGGVGVNNISVVDPAQRPQFPSSPNLRFNLLLALFAGLLIGGGIAFILEQIDQGITDPSQIETLLHMPLLGTIPQAEGGSPIEVITDVKSAVAEAYISMQTNLAFTTDHGVARSLAVTSSKPAEGKSTTSYALADGLARLRKKVVLVDMDLRSPSIHLMMDVANEGGVSNYLAGDDNLMSFVHPTQRPDLFFVTAGPQPPSAPELLSSDRLPRMIELLLQTFDHVIVDIPPVMGLADAPIISSHVEGVIFVVEAHHTPRGVAQVAIDRLLATNARLVGVLLTKFDAKRAHYGYGYDYGYGYGETEAAKKTAGRD